MKASKCKQKAVRAATSRQDRQAREDAADVAEAMRRLKDPKRKIITVVKLKAELGL